MVSARELAPQLPARADTWVNRHLQYTHGYGLAMSPVSQEGTEGLPQFLIQDLPPVTRHDLTVQLKTSQSTIQAEIKTVTIIIPIELRLFSFHDLEPELILRDIKYVNEYFL